MPNVRVPPPPRRAPAVAPSTREAASDRFILTNVIVSLGGAALISKRLLQMKDSVGDVQVALATADESLKAISTNPAVRPPSLRYGSATGGDDLQSLAFASATLSRLIEEDKKQDAFYSSLRETALVRAEVQRALKDPTLQRYRQQVECQLAFSSTTAQLTPRLRRSGAPPKQHQVLLNPYSVVRRQLLDSVATAPPRGSDTSPSAKTPTASAERLQTSKPVAMKTAYHTSTSTATPSPPSGSHGRVNAYSPYSSLEGRPVPVYGGYNGSAVPQQPPWTSQPAAHGPYGQPSQMPRWNPR
ncbi:hypothetical protein JKF63_03317 [Porcisia hertigi]|uniref:Uncharacterized protein n=1 Tax=Porcisia hertigi TaxID=2761500 RepID=A0A836LH96_9TRYP|nr:hypothetical protein JKF63_03317 [Porcisia hertigi]